MLRIINDNHIGAIRPTGTTPSTQLVLRQYLIDGFAQLLPESDLMILGDLFDKENIPISDVLQVYFLLLDWLLKGHNLYLVAGNHDLSRTSSIMSSFDFLGSLLTSLFPSQVTVIKAAQMTPYGYVIPHVPNQDLFNLELDKVPETSHLFLHCNYDNNFASMLDQSLNLSSERASTIPAKQIIIAHEHYHREMGKVLLPGNQVPSSCADWANPQDKFYIQLDSGVSKLVQCNARSVLYSEYDWRNLSLSSVPKFARITGTATTEEAAKVVTAVSKFRQATEALIVSNGVLIESDDTSSQFEASLDGVKSFSVWDALKKILSPAEILTLESVMHDEE